MRRTYYFRNMPKILYATVAQYAICARNEIEHLHDARNYDLFQVH